MLTIRALIFVVVLFAMEYAAYSQSPFYRRFEGKYGKQSMVINFSYQAGGISGNYYIKDNPVVVKEFGGKSTLAGTYAYFEILSDSAQVGTEAAETLSGVLAGPKFDGSHVIAGTKQSTQFSLREGYSDATQIKLNAIRDDVRKADYGMVLYITINYPLIGEKVFDDAVKVFADSFIGSGKPMMEYLDETIANYKKIISDTNNAVPARKNYRIMTDIQMNDRNIVSVLLKGIIKEDEKPEIKSNFILNYNKESNSVITTDKILKGEWTKFVNDRFKDTFNDDKINYQASNTVGKQNFIVQPDGIKFLITDGKHVPIHQIKLTYTELNEFLTGSLPL